MVALRATVCRICENDIAWSAGKRVANIMQGAADGSEPVCAMFAQRAGTPFIVSAATDKFWFWQILNTRNSLRFICYIFTWSKHLDNLQYRFTFPYWNIGFKMPKTSKNSVLLLQSHKISQLQAKLSSKDEVIAEIMASHIELKKSGSLK
jgi:hypothetical protein